MNTPKALLKKVLLMVGLAGFALSLAVLSLVIFKSPVQSISPPPDVIPIAFHQKVSYGVPVHLRIPAIDVDAVLETVGITVNGEMDTPKDPANAAWFNLGPHPGEVGNAVIDGHLDWFNGASAVFENLSKLQKGDKIYVVDERGVTTTFMVREFGIYDQNQDATSVFRSVDGKAHLNIITCEGAWSRSQQSYSSRLVVFSNRQI